MRRNRTLLVAIELLETRGTRTLLYVPALQLKKIGGSKNKTGGMTPTSLVHNALTAQTILKQY